MESNLDKFIPENLRGVFINKASAKQVEPNLAGDGASSCVAENKENKGEQTMETKPEIAEAVKAEVEAILAEKDAQEKVEARISGLESEKASLQAKIDELTVANESLQKEFDALSEAKAELEKKNSDLVSEKESAVAECETVKSELATIKKEQVTASRKNELATAGLLVSDEKLQEKQIAKISEMSDEQFADYVSELSAIAKATKETKPETTPAEPAVATTTEQEPAKASASTPATDGQLYVQAIASIQAPSGNQDNINKYAQM